MNRTLYFDDFGQNQALFWVFAAQLLKRDGQRCISRIEFGKSGRLVRRQADRTGEVRHIFQGRSRNPSEPKFCDPGVSN
jgi:hypothetical protein